MEFSEKIIKFRAKWNLSQEEAAEILGVNKNMIYRYENNLVNPRKVNLIAFDEKMRKWEEKNNENV